MKYFGILLFFCLTPLSVFSEDLITRAPRSETAQVSFYGSLIPGIPQTSAPNFSVANSLTVGNTLTVQDLDVTGTIILPSTVDFTGGATFLDDSSSHTSCLLYKESNGSEKARICSAVGAGASGLRMSTDGGTTEHLAISGGGTVAIAKDVTVGQGTYANNLFVAGNAQVSGTTLLQTSFLEGTTNVQGPVYFTQGIPGISKNKLLVSKGSISGPNEFNSIRSALESIIDSSESNQFEIEVGPGVFVEETLVMKPYVSLHGAGDDMTIIRPQNSHSTILIGASHSRVDGCMFEGATDLGAAAIVYDSAEVFDIADCVFGSNDTLIRIVNNTAPYTFIRLSRLFINSNAQFRYGIYFDGDGVFPLLGEISGITWLAENNPDLVSFFFITGSMSEFICNSMFIGNPMGVAGTGITLQNGARLRLANSQFFGFAQQSIWAPNVGVGPTINAIAVLGSYNNCDIKIEHPGIQGVIDGIFARNKVSVVDGAEFAMFLVDPAVAGTVTVGPQYAGTELDKVTYISPLFDDQVSMGVLSGGAVTRLGGLSVSVTSGSGYLGIYEAHHGDIEHHHLKHVTWSDQTITLPALQDGYLYVDALGVVNFANAEPDPREVIVLGRATTTASDVLYIQDIQRSARNVGTNIDTTLRKALGPIYSSGSIVSKYSDNQLAVSQGVYFYSTHEFHPAGGSPIGWSAFYADGSSGFVSEAQTVVDYQRYDDGTGMRAAVPGNDFIRHALYVVGDGVEERYLWVYGREVYTSLLDAQNGSIPPAPGFFGGNIALIASIITKNSGIASEWISEIRDERPRLGFRASGISSVTAHGDLSGLANDDHTQYLLANGTRALSGSLNLTNNPIVNAGAINGVAIAAHAARHRPGGADALPVGVPVTIGISNAEGIENTFSRADHVHAHGNLVGGSLHAVATSAVAGFMAAADKSKLDALNASDFVQIAGSTMTGALDIDHSGARSLVVGADRLVVSADTGAVTMSGLSEGVVHAQAGGVLGSSLIVDADVDASTQIVLGSQKALNATSTSTADRIVVRDASGNFAANAITANLVGNATTATTATSFSGSLSGDVTGAQSSTVVGSVGGESAASIASGTVLANQATHINTANRIVRRDASGNFAAGTITGTLSGNATTATTATNFTGSLAGEVVGTQGATVVAFVGGQASIQVGTASVLANAATSSNTANQLVRRDASGNFSAGTITANLSGNATTATSAGSFTGSLSGDVTGAQSSTVVGFVGGEPAASVASGTVLANQATHVNTASRIVRRDASGNFAAGTITGTLSGNATTATTATNFTGSLLGDVTGTQGVTAVATVGGQTAADVASGAILANQATNLNTASRIVRRDASGNFSAGTITANLSGNASTATSAGSFTGTLSGDVTGTQGATVGGASAADVASATVLANAATSSNTVSRIVRRDASGNFAAGIITADLVGNVTGNVSGSSASFTGALSGDVTGTQGATTVATVGGQTSADVASGAVLANAATHLNTASQIVRRDVSGNFAAGTITGTLSGNATTATTATNFTGSLLGDVTGTQGVTAVATVGGQTAADVASGAILANQATNLNTASRIVRRDASGNFSAGTITANLSGNATTATSAGSFTGALSGDVTGTQGATVVASVGGASAADVASATVLANAATSSNTVSRIVRRDASGNFAAGTITADLVGNVTGNVSGSAASFTGALSGDVTGTQGATTVATVGGQTSADVASGAVLANTATHLNTVNQIVRRDAAGNFLANQITASLIGSASANVLKSGDTMTGALTLSGSGSSLTVGGTTLFNNMVYFTQGLPCCAPQELIVIQGNISAPNQFTSIKAAVDSITTASVDNPFVIKVGPGIFVEDPIVLKPYVIVVGSGDDGTVIMPTTATNTILYGAPNARVSGCAFTGATGVGGAAIRYDGGGVFEVYDCVFGHNETLIALTNGTTPRTFIRLDRLFVRSEAQFVTGIHANGSGVYPLCGEIKGITWLSEGNPLLDSFFFITGSNFQAVLSDICIGNPVGTPGTGITLQDGAVARIKNSQMFGFNQQAFYVPNIGAGPTINAMAVFGINNTLDANIQNPLLQGVIDGIFSQDKVAVAPGTNIAMFLVDPTNEGTITVGPQYAGTELDKVTYVSPLFDDQASTGVLTGGAVSVASGLEVAVVAGTGYLLTEYVPATGHGHLRHVTWTSQNVTLPANSEGYLFVNDDGTITFSTTEPSPLVKIILARIRSSASSIVYVQEIARNARNIGTNIDTLLREALGPIYVTGSLVSKISDTQMAVSEGLYFYSTYEFAPSGGSPVDWQAFYRDGVSSYIVVPQSAVDYNHYDDGSGTLASVPLGKFVRHALFVVGDGAQEQYLFVYGREIYDSLLDAQNGTIPPKPGSWGGNIALIASIITENSGTSSEWISELRDERPRLGFKASGLSVITAHGDLSGLANDDHTQYLLASGARAMAGNLDLGANAITNAGLINGVTITAHAARHVPNGLDPLPVAAPVTISTANAEGIANTFSRSDHVHAHGDLAGGTLHATATSGGAGFMSAADKTLLDSLDPSLYLLKTGGTLTGSVVWNQPTGNAIAINTNKFVVDAPTGNTSIGGTLGIAGAVTCSDLGLGLVHAGVSGSLTSSLLVDADVNPASGIYTGSVLANAATSSNTASQIVRRDASGDFAAGTITANLIGTVTGNVSGSAASFTGPLSGDVTGTQSATLVATVGGQTATDVASATVLAQQATSVNTANRIVRRDASGNFAAGTITADLVGNASTATSATNFTGSLSGDVTGTQGATLVATVGGQTAADVASATVLTQNATNLNTVNQIVRRDASGSFSAGTITANLVGSVTGNVSGSAASFTGSLSGDVTGTQSATLVATVGGQTAAAVASGAVLANTATSLNTVSQIVRRDASGNFAAGTITANLAGNASTATSATNFSGSLSGDVTGTQGSTVVATVGGETAVNVASGAVLANAATSVNTANQIVRRDASGNFAAGTITADLIGNASTATSATSFTGSLSGDVTGTQGATLVATVGGQTATDVASATVLTQNATNLNTASQIVRRDASGNFSAGTITANLLGNASTATSATNFSGSLSGDVTGTQGSTLVATVGGQTAADVASATVLTQNATNLNTASQIVRRDASGNFSAGTITATLLGNATSATTAINFSGLLSGDVTGTQGSTVVTSVGGQLAADVTSGVVLANAATSSNTSNQIVRRDVSGNFSAGTITANLIGNASTATSAKNFSGSLSGDVTGTQGATVVGAVGGQTATDVASATVLANAATSLNTASQIVRRDASGNFSAGTITANLLGNASTATSATNFSGSLNGDVTGGQTTTVVAAVGGQTAANVATATILANAATHLNTANQIVRRDGTGNFSAGTITANLIGNVTGTLTGSATNNVLKAGDTMTGPLVFADQNSIQLREQLVNGTEFVALRANASMPTSYTLTLPAVQGLAGQSLVNDGAGNLNWATAGGGSLPRYTVHAYMNNNFPMTASTSVIIPYETELIDLNGNYNPATYAYTAPVTGYYQVSASCSVTSTNTFDRYIRLLKNSSPIVGYSYFWQETRVGGHLAAVVQLTAGDILQVQYQGRSNDTIVGGGASTLSIQFLTT